MAIMAIPVSDSPFFPSAELVEFPARRMRSGSSVAVVRVVVVDVHVYSQKYFETEGTAARSPLSLQM
jgi:hypothetical protein